jgi:hypothetical protein
MSKESVAMTLARWEQLLAAWEANPGDLSHIEEYRVELQQLVDRIKELGGEQDALNARKQQVTRDLDTAKERGREIAVRVRTGVRSRYGDSGEKLTEFGLRPRRGVSRPLKRVPPE